MNGLELTLKVVRFLLLPEDLTWFFLPVLIAVFAIGSFYAVWHGWLLRGRLQTIQKAYEEGPAHRRVTPRAYIQMCLEEDTDRQMVDGVPSLLVTIGILGTFLGLGIALQVAGGGLTSSESALASLDTLLKTVAFKFQTSAWGILLSIVFQIVIVNPHHRWAERAHERAERAMLSVYLPAGEAMRVALEPVIASLGDATQEVAKTSARMVTAMTDFQNNMDVSTQRLEKAMGALDGLGTRLDNAIYRMGISVASTLKAEVDRQSKQSLKQQEVLQDQMESVVIAVRALQDTTATVGPTLQSAVSRMQTAITENLSAELKNVAAAIAKLDGVMGTLETRMSSSLTSVVNAIGNMERAQGSAFKQLDNGLTVRLGEVASVLTNLDASLKGQLENLNSELGTHLGATKEHTLELSVTMTEVREALQGLEKHVGRMVDVLEVAESGRAADELSDLLDLGAFGAQIADDG